MGGLQSKNANRPRLPNGYMEWGCTLEEEAKLTMEREIKSGQMTLDEAMAERVKVHLLAKKINDIIECHSAFRLVRSSEQGESPER